VPGDAPFRAFFEPPAEPPREIARRLGPIARRAHHAVVELHLRREHHLRGLRLQALAGDGRGDEAAVVGGGRDETGGGVHRGRRGTELERHADVGVARRDVGAVVDERAARHPERLEHHPLRRGLERRAGDRLDDALQVDVALTGIAEALAGREEQLQRIAPAPVGEAGRVRQHVTRRHRLRARIVGEIRIRHVLRQRRIEREASRVDQLQRDIGGDRLAEGRRLEPCRPGHRGLAAGAHHAEAPGPGHASPIDDGDGETGHPRLLHQPRQVRGEPRGDRVDIPLS